MPTTWLSVLLFMVVIAPGLLFDLGSSSRLVRAKESAFHEIARITLASLFFSGMAVGLAVLAHGQWPETFLNLDQAIRGGWGFVKDHQVPAAASLLLVFFSSLAAVIVVNLSWTLCIHGWGKPWIRSKSAWSLVFKPGRLDRGTTVMATAALSDGSVVRGRVTEFSADLEREDRELVLASPITIRGKDKEKSAVRPELGAVILTGIEVIRLQVEYLRPEDPSEWRMWDRLTATAASWTPIVGAAVVAALITSVTNAMWGGASGTVAAVMLHTIISRVRNRDTAGAIPESEVPIPTPE